MSRAANAAATLLAPVRAPAPTSPRGAHEDRSRAPARSAGSPGYKYTPVSPEPQDNPQALLARLLDAEPGAWHEMIERYSPFLLAVTRRTFQGYGVRPERVDCEDAVAEVWKNLVENDHKVVRDCLARNSLLPTLQVLARHRAIDIMRRRRHTLSLSDAPPGVEPAAEPAPSDFPTEGLAAALEHLTPRERTVVNLFFLQGRKYREIAALTGIPQNSIGPTLSRALARLRQVIRL